MKVDIDTSDIKERTDMIIESFRTQQKVIESYAVLLEFVIKKGIECIKGECKNE